MGGRQAVSGKSGPRGSFPATDAVMAAAILVLGLSLAGSGGSMMQRWRSSSVRQQSLSFEDQLGIITNATGLIVVTWWSLSLAVAVASALLERSGRTGAASATAKFSPAFMRRLALAALGFQLIAAPLATAATAPRPDPLPRPAVSARWTPTTAAADGLVLPRPLLVLAPPAPDPAPRSAPGNAGPGRDAARPWTPRVPAVEPGPLAARELRTQDPADGSAEVTVRVGDSLWSLAAARLGPLASDADIAREWPRLYAANRSVIGGTPHLLHPGQVLKLPQRE